MDEMSMCTVKGTDGSERPMEKFPQILRFPSGLQIYLVSVHYLLSLGSLWKLNDLLNINAHLVTKETHTLCPET